MNTEQFIKDADVVIGGTHLTEYEALLDPQCWQAVGKTREWDGLEFHSCCAKHDTVNRPTSTGRCSFGAHCTGHYRGHGKMWLEYQHRFIDHRADGDSIEEALGKLK